MSEFDDESNIMVSELRIIKYIDGDGDLHVVDLSQAAGGDELDEPEYLSLIEWARAYILADNVMSIIASRTEDYGDDE